MMNVITTINQVGSSTRPPDRVECAAFLNLTIQRYYHMNFVSFDPWNHKFLGIADFKMLNGRRKYMITSIEYSVSLYSQAPFLSSGDRTHAEKSAMPITVVSVFQLVIQPMRMFLSQVREF